MQGVVVVLFSPVFPSPASSCFVFFGNFSFVWVSFFLAGEMRNVARQISTSLLSHLHDTLLTSWPFTLPFECTSSCPYTPFLRSKVEGAPRWTRARRRRHSSKHARARTRPNKPPVFAFVFVFCFFLTIRFAKDDASDVLVFSLVFRRRLGGIRMLCNFQHTRTTRINRAYFPDAT